MTQNAPKNWTELVAVRPPVPPFRPFRFRKDDDVLQYVRDGQEFLAVRDRQPYGALTETTADPQKAYELHLLAMAGQGEDFMVFHVPEDVLSLKAITLGSSHRGDMLYKAYADVGRTIKGLLEIVPIPPIVVDDIVIGRPSGEVFFIPPIAFGAGNQDPEAHATELTESMQDIVHFWPERAVDSLADHIQNGLVEQNVAPR